MSIIPEVPALPATFPEHAPDATDYLYKEYVRLSERCIWYVKSSFEDIRLYAGLGGVLTWTISKVSTNPKELLLGFVAIRVIVSILSIYTLIRQVLVEFYLNELGGYESQIRQRLGLEDAAVFHWTENYRHCRATEVRSVFTRLSFMTNLLLIGFPFVVLFGESQSYAWIYLGVAILCLSVELRAYSKRLRETPAPSPRNPIGY